MMKRKHSKKKIRSKSSNASKTTTSNGKSRISIGRLSRTFCWNLLRSFKRTTTTPSSTTKSYSKKKFKKAQFTRRKCWKNWIRSSRMKSSKDKSCVKATTKYVMTIYNTNKNWKISSRLSRKSISISNLARKGLSN